MQTTHCKINKLQLICFNISISFQISPVLLTPFLILKINIWRKVVDVIVEPWTRNINSLLSLFQEWIICSRNQGCILPPPDEITTPGREKWPEYTPLLDFVYSTSSASMLAPLTSAEGAASPGPRISWDIIDEVAWERTFCWAP